MSLAPPRVFRRIDLVAGVMVDARANLLRSNVIDAVGHQTSGADPLVEGKINESPGNSPGPLLLLQAPAVAAWKKQESGTESQMVTTGNHMTAYLTPRCRGKSAIDSAPAYIERIRSQTVRSREYVAPMHDSRVFIACI